MGTGVIGQCFQSSSKTFTRQVESQTFKSVSVHDRNMEKMSSLSFRRHCKRKKGKSFDYYDY